MIATDRLPDAPGAALRRGRVCRLLLWWSRPSLSSCHRCVPTCTHCCITVMTMSTCVRHMVAASRCSGCCWGRMVSPHHQQVGTSNLLMHDVARVMKVVGSIGSSANHRQMESRSISSVATWSKAVKDFKDKKI
jgi:hypothetical protein